MNPALKEMLKSLLNRRYIGYRHTPEEKPIKRWTRNNSKEEKREFEKEYKQMINEGFIIRMKKRTGKGSDWHISLNPRMIKELRERLENGNRSFL